MRSSHSLHVALLLICLTTSPLAVSQIDLSLGIDYRNSNNFLEQSNINILRGGDDGIDSSSKNEQNLGFRISLSKKINDYYFAIGFVDWGNQQLTASDSTTLAINQNSRQARLRIDSSLKGLYVSFNPLITRFSGNEIYLSSGIIRLKQSGKIRFEVDSVINGGTPISFFQQEDISDYTTNVMIGIAMRRDKLNLDLNYLNTGSSNIATFSLGWSLGRF